MANPSSTKEKCPRKFSSLGKNKKGGILKILRLMTQPNTFVTLNIFLHLKIVFKDIYFLFSLILKTKKTLSDPSQLLRDNLPSAAVWKQKKLHKKR